MAETSLDAHRTSNRSGLCDQVLRLCRRLNGCTIDEAAVELERDCSSVSGRFSELYDAGLIGKASMLVITRERGQKFFCSDRGGPLVEVEVVDIRGDKVRLGITAPEDVRVLREELAREIPRPPKSLAAE